MKPHSHILVIRFSAMGDVAMTVPVLQRLVKTYPHLKITVLTKPFFKPIFEEVPGVNIVTADVKQKYKGIFGLWKLARELKLLQLDAVADLHNVLRTKILRFFLFFFGIKSAVINKGRAEKKDLTKLAPKIIKPLKTTHQRYADVFAKLALPIDLNSPITADKHSLPQLLKTQLKDYRKWIGIAPFAAHKPKMYPLSKTEEVIAQLDASGQYDILLFGGGKKEKQQLDQMASRYQNVYSMVGKLSFKEELQTVSNLDVMLSMDSGNGHLASIFNIPVITIWGATHPYAGFAPFQQAPKYQLLPDLEKYPLVPTSIYGNKEIEGYEDLMESISFVEILNIINHLLEKNE
ncbi:glycosyltransferase family 9 protein [Mesonia aestuariivivens]|uniref:Glycosyltransferase family 9 protein n=1 Tax=Mesonia aestuariivivens TaxID=2796128 RepID=A0ABS6W114_9FLAO|nr:glycosyltransferase family 9 protein [Mesonia aestuariivivens]MBW2961509.1 glycosyltransferase family 9 protein [Mesonia aestuariivivens]